MSSVKASFEIDVVRSLVIRDRLIDILFRQKHWCPNNAHFECTGLKERRAVEVSADYISVDLERRANLVLSQTRNGT